MISLEASEAACNVFCMEEHARMEHPGKRAGQSSDRFRIAALLPVEIARKAETIGAQKAHLDTLSLFVLAVLAGAFIALGAMFATTALAGAAGVLPFGVCRVL